MTARQRVVVLVLVWFLLFGGPGLGTTHSRRRASRQAARRSYESWREQFPSVLHVQPYRRASTCSATVRFRLTAPDRKSTRLNSSHANISYAVFCLKKKKKSSIIKTE